MPMGIGGIQAHAAGEALGVNNNAVFVLCQAACSTLKFRKNPKCPFEWTLRVFSSFRNLLKNRG